MPVSGRKALLRKGNSILPPAEMTPEEMVIRGTMAQQWLLSTFTPFLGCKVALYAPLAREVGTDVIAASVRAAGGTTCYPHLSPGEGLRFFPVGDDAIWVKGRYGIPVPRVDSEDDALVDGFDLVVVPGVAFDAEGRRLGRGGGYYDRFLSKLSSGVRIAGLAFSWQIVSEVPVEYWDVRVDEVVTENGVIRVPGSTGIRTCK